MEHVKNYVELFNMQIQIIYAKIAIVILIVKLATVLVA